MKKVPDCIRKWVYSVLDEVSDELGRERRGRWLLVYEGWSAFCIEPVWDPPRPDEENEDVAYEYAAEQSSVVIAEWVEEFAATHDPVGSGYEPTGVYGVTWALFIRRAK
jgi:hypothetical protein